MKNPNNRKKDCAQSYRDLAFRLGVTVDTVSRLTKMPGHPMIGAGKEKFHVPAWRKFAAAETKATIRNTPSPVTSAKAQLADEAVRKAKRENLLADRELIYRSEANETIHLCNNVVIREITKAIEHELPPVLEGMSAAEIQKELKATFRRIFEKLPKQIEGA